MIAECFNTYTTGKEPLYTVGGCLKWPSEGWTVQDTLFQLQARNRSAKKTKASVQSYHGSLNVAFKSFAWLIPQKGNDQTAFSWYNSLQLGPYSVMVDPWAQWRVRIMTSSQRSGFYRIWSSVLASVPEPYREETHQRTLQSLVPAKLEDKWTGNSPPQASCCRGSC